ncbi:MAG: ACT domain-containing protein [Erysipelotrichales bacterium]|nr:ACT domain-containing protein [Erysipelotrichales bacterium]
MADKYLIVNQKILPDFYDKVIEARNMIQSGQCKNVSEAVKQVGISRSTYYKFKDYIYLPTENSVGKKAVISCMLMHRRGVLSDVLNLLSAYYANILTINQSIPINGQAAVTISLDINDVPITIDELTEKIHDLRGVTQAKLVAFD